MMDWVIETGIAVSLLITLVLITRRPFAKMFGARAAYALWVLPFIRLVMPEVTIPRIFPRVANNALPETALSKDMVLTPEILAALQAEPTLMSQAEPYILPTILGLWAIGAVIFFLYHWTRQVSYMDQLTYASEPANHIRQALASAARATGLKRIPQVRISDEKAGPLVAGFLRPIVILPDNFMTAFTPQQRHYALMHEFMHIKRGDIWVALAWLGFRAVNWPNPLVHYAAKHFRSDQEAACDASVLNAMGDTKEAAAGYAETLIHAAKTAISDGRASPQPSALALTIHHPLKERLMILGTHRKTSKWRSRTAAAIMIIGAATLSAPLIQADAHPETAASEEELAGKAEKQTSRSIIKRMTDREGEKIAEHYEINVDGDKVEAFEIDIAGRKTSIDPNQIEGLDLNLVGNGHAAKWMKDNPGHKGKRVIRLGSGEKQIVLVPNKDFDGDVRILSDQITVHNDDEFPNTPTPPEPPRFSSRAEGVITFESDDLEGLKGLKGLEASIPLESLEAFEGLQALGEAKSFIVFSKGDEDMSLEKRVTESHLAVASQILEKTSKDLEGDSREMAKAKRELEKARKALKAAERALKDSE